MPTIPATHIQKLRDADLFISEDFPADHKAFPSDVRVATDPNVAGNSIADFEFCWAMEPGTFEQPVTVRPSDLADDDYYDMQLLTVDLFAQIEGARYSASPVSQLSDSSDSEALSLW